MGTTPVAGRIFVSYRREDSAYATGWLTDRLTEHYGGGEVFTDVDSIEIGDDFVGRITEAVASCDVLLAVIGQKWLTAIDKAGHRRLDDPNDYVRIEIEAALRRDVLVIPILVDHANMPGVSDLPGRPEVPGGHPEPRSLATLTRREALSLTPNQFDWALDRLLKKLDKALLSSGGTKAKTNRGVPPPRKQAKQTLPDLVRWTAIGLLATAIGMLLIKTAEVTPAVQQARVPQPDNDAWMRLIWLSPAAPAAVALGLLIRNRLSALGTVVGCGAVAAWLVAASWAALSDQDDTHSLVHAIIVLLLVSATIGVAAAIPARERVGLNPASQVFFALFLAVVGFLLRSQAEPLRRAIDSSVGNGPHPVDVDWALKLDDAQFWLVQLGLFAVCVAAAMMHGNRVQSQVLRTFVGVVVLYEMALLLGRVANQFEGVNDMDVGFAVFAVMALLIAAGLFFMWWAVAVGQPKQREASRPSTKRPPRAASLDEEPQAGLEFPGHKPLRRWPHST